MGESVSGGCLCGAVRFRVELPTRFCAHCHCSSLDGPIDRAPAVHVYSDSGAEWTDVRDGLPRLGGATGVEPLRDDPARTLRGVDRRA